MLALSDKSKTDLRKSLRSSYGEVFEAGLSDEEVNQLGVLVLTVLSESLKLEIANPELFIPMSK